MKRIILILTLLLIPCLSYAAESMDEYVLKNSRWFKLWCVDGKQYMQAGGPTQPVSAVINEDGGAATCPHKEKK